MSKRGEIGPNAGKKSSTYNASLPDGTNVRKRSMNVHSVTAFLACFQTQDGKWFASGISETIKDWGKQVWAPAKKVENL